MGVKYSQLLKEQELENVKFQNQRLEMNDQLSGLKIRMKEMVSFEQKYAEIEPELKRYREKAGALALELESVKGTLAQKDSINARLKEELKRQEAEFEEMDQENAVKVDRPLCFSFYLDCLFKLSAHMSKWVQFR